MTMRLLYKDDKSSPKIEIHNGDPRRWPPGMYRSRVNPRRVVLVIDGHFGGSNVQAAFVVTSTGAYALDIPQSDGYVLLPKGETITIEA